jgi:hypothetical protein
MEAKDSSMGFDYKGTFTREKPHEPIHYELEGKRVLMVEFMQTANRVKVIETFEVEDKNSAEQQKQVRQSIFINFNKHGERKSS